MQRIIPKTFEYKGYECEVKESPIGTFGCGYVKLTSEHKYYSVHYDDIPVQCHGGLTFAKQKDDKWVIGFDCGNSNDVIPYFKEPDGTFLKCLVCSEGATFKDNEFIENEIKKIVDQLGGLK